MRQPDPNLPRPTPEEIARLIAETYSAQPPDPSTHAPATQKIVEALEIHPPLEGLDTITQVSIEVHGYPDWQPESADKLYNFLSDNHPDPELRIQELRDGAPLTEDEQEEYENEFLNWGSFTDVPVFYVFRLRAPESTGETRAVYFVQEWREMGQLADVYRTVGPFRTAKEVKEALEGKNGSPLTPNTFGIFLYNNQGDAAFTAALEAA